MIAHTKSATARHHLVDRPHVPDTGKAAPDRYRPKSLPQITRIRNKGVLNACARWESSATGTQRFGLCQQCHYAENRAAQEKRNFLLNQTPKDRKLVGGRTVDRGSASISLSGTDVWNRAFFLTASNPNSNSTNGSVISIGLLINPSTKNSSAKPIVAGNPLPKTRQPVFFALLFTYRS